MNQQQSDPVIDEIREVRHQISARVDHDPARLVEYYMTLQEQYRDRLVDTSKTSERADQSAA
jgi:hypothetical protein